MIYTDDQIRYACAAEYEYLCHDIDFDPEEDMTQEQYEEHLTTLTTEQLLEEACLDGEYYTLDHFMEYWGE